MYMYIHIHIHICRYSPLWCPIVFRSLCKPRETLENISLSPAGILNLSNPSRSLNVVGATPVRGPQTSDLPPAACRLPPAARCLPPAACRLPL